MKTDHLERGILVDLRWDHEVALSDTLEREASPPEAFGIFRSGWLTLELRAVWECGCGRVTLHVWTAANPKQNNETLNPCFAQSALFKCP